MFVTVVDSLIRYLYNTLFSVFKNIVFERVVIVFRHVCLVACSMNVHVA